jgi:AcrR family transcriptional regulator
VSPTSRSRVRARPGDGPLLRNEILRAATDLLDEAGDESALTLRAVATRVGVTTPSVYLHFADKDALVEAVCLQVWEDLGAAMRVAGESVDDPFQALRRKGGTFVRFGLGHPVQYRLLMMRQSTGRAAADACLLHVQEALRPCLESGVLTGDPVRLSLRMLAALHGLVALYLVQPGFPWPDDVDALGDEMVRMSGLGSAVLGRLDTGAPPPDSTAFTAGFDAFAERMRASAREPS